MKELNLHADRLSEFDEMTLDTRPTTRHGAAMPASPGRDQNCAPEYDENLRRRRAIVDSAVDFAIVATDQQGSITDWSVGAQRIMGWSSHEMLGQPADRIFTPEDRAGGRPEFEMRRSLEDGRASDERWHLRKDGSRFWASGEMMPLRDDTDRHLGFVKILRDRTTEHQAAQALIAAESRLRESEDHFRHTVELNPQVTWTADPQGNVDSYSKRWLELTGQEPGEPDGAGWIKALHPDDVEMTIKVFSTCLASGEAVDVDYRVWAAPVQGYRWMRARAFPRRDDTGQIIRWYGVVEDDHHRKTAEIALRESEEQFRVFAQAVPNHLWASNPEGALYWFNEQVYAYSGTEHGSLDGSAWAALLHPDDVPAGGAAWLKSIETGEVYETEFRIRRADGEYRWFLVRAEPVRSQVGNIIRWIGTNTDIHERKLAETAVARQFERAWELSPILKIIVSSDGILLATNPGFAATLGWKPDDVLGRPVSDLLATEDRATSALRRETLVTGQTLPEYQVSLLCKAGGQRRISWTTVVEDDKIFAFGRDVTVEQQQAEALARSEDALRQSQKMEAVGQLTGGLAHDFNNLLTAVTGGLELLQNRLAAGRYDGLDRYVEMARTGANRAAALTQRLLAFSRRQTLAPTPTDVNRLIGGMRDIIDRSIGPTIDVNVIDASNLWPVLVDSPQLESALLNLCINARDAMPGGGTITIKTANKVLDTQAAGAQDLAEGEYVLLCVADTGTGMASEVIERVFDPFFTTKPIGQGTGLGLSMIYGFVRQSGGQVRIQSEVGTGTTMQLFLPRYAGKAAEPVLGPALAREDRVSSGQTVLLVEDEAAIAQLVTEILSDAGYQVVTATTGPDGVGLLRSQQRIDLLITDVGLPGGLNGRQVADAGRESRPDLKILFITGYAANAAVGAGQLEQGMEVLTKPFNMLELERRVRAILDNHDLERTTL